jgi:hypothetical protein
MCAQEYAKVVYSGNSPLAQDLSTVSPTDAQLLSPLNYSLAAELRRDPVLAAARFDIHHESIPEFLHGYPYTSGMWPVFVNRRAIREHFEPLISAMPAILYPALRARFSDSEALAEYFGWPDIICQIADQAQVDPRDMLIRFDAVQDASGLKLLEGNCGTSAGGWHTDYFHLQMRARLARFAQSQGSSFVYRPILRSLLKVVAAGIHRRRPAGASGNLLVHWTFSSGAPDLNVANFRDSMQAVYDTVKQSALADGRVFIFREFEEIGFTAAGEVTAHGEIMDAIILGDALLTNMPPALLNRLIAAYLRQQLVFPDSPFNMLLSDKGLLAVLHECRMARLLDDDACALIERYVPWTTRLLDEEVLLEGVQVPLIRHLLAHKDDFVIKKFDSSAGRAVLVGRHVDAATWERIIPAYAESQTRWIVQQYCAPSRLELHDAEQGIVPHALIWGIFSCGTEYGGAWIRTDRGAGLQGVINSGTGATDMPVFEVD